LLTIAATVGLTFAVVKLSQDVSVSENNAMVAKDSGAALETGANIRSATLAEIMASPNPAAMLTHQTHLTVPDAGDEDLVVHGVASAALLADGAGLRVRTVGNEMFEFAPAPAPAAPAAAGSPTTTRCARQRHVRRPRGRRVHKGRGLMPNVSCEHVLVDRDLQQRRRRQIYEPELVTHLGEV
jgi:hypothetical protein